MGAGDRDKRNGFYRDRLHQIISIKRSSLPSVNFLTLVPGWRCRWQISSPTVYSQIISSATQSLTCDFEVSLPRPPIIRIHVRSWMPAIAQKRINGSRPNRGRAGVRCFSGSRLDNLATGDAMILDAVGRAEGLESHFHGLQRVPGYSSLGAYHYQPIRISRHAQPSSAVRLLLAFDALILDHLQGCLPEYGVIICGPTFKRIRIRLRAYLGSLATVLRHLQLQLTGGEEPLLTLNLHCDLCEFRQFCRPKAEETDNLTRKRGKKPGSQADSQRCLTRSGR
jgi:hypothetical protein